ncbi:hypothetical protein BHM03_00062721, partial [Ensete ventricosum]
NPLLVGRWGRPLRAGRWRLPLVGWLLASAPYRRNATSNRARGWLSPLRAGRSRSPPMQGALAAADHPFVWGLGRSRSPPCRWPTTLAGGLAMASHPYRWPSHGRLPPFLVMFTAKT